MRQTTENVRTKVVLAIKSSQQKTSNLHNKKHQIFTTKYIKSSQQIKRCFCDPSVAVAALELSPEALQMQLKTFGYIFEQLCIRDLRAFTQNNHFSHLSYYHDRYGLEADIVLHINADKYALIECKLGSREIDEGAEHLLELKRLIIEHNKAEKQMPIREPDVQMIITGGQYAYRRADGVYVVPIGCLRD